MRNDEILPTAALATVFNERRSTIPAYNIAQIQTKHIVQRSGLFLRHLLYANFRKRLFIGRMNV